VTRTETSWMPAPFARTTLPGRIVFGNGALANVPAELDALGAQRAMLIVADYDGVLAEQGSRVLGTRLRLAWGEVRQHVPRELAVRASAAAVADGIDVLVTIGGGSTIGLGKAIAVDTGLPLLTVPTTYSGSEMTPIYGLTADNDKKTARDINALPKVVVYDPQLLTTLPPAVVGPSGMNALAHCAEALWAPQTDPLTDALALDGAHRLREHLYSAYADADADARGQILIASCLAGVALGTVGTSLHHGLCHLLGGLFDTPHADTHAIVLPYVVDFLRPAIPVAMERLSAAMSSTAADLADTIWSLARSVGTPHGLREIGVTQTQIGEAVDAAMAKKLTSPRTLERAGLHHLLTAAWSGDAPSAA
jgi:maleylacetate reductase